MWPYLVLYSVKGKYWNDFVSKVYGFVFGKMKILEWLCRENEILVYMPTSLINGKFELVPWYETWYVTLFGFKLVKWKYWNDPCCENEILAYMVTILINKKVELVPWCKTWYFNLFSFKFGKIKVLNWLFPWSLINIWTCPLLHLVANMICEPIWFCIR